MTAIDPVPAPLKGRPTVASSARSTRVSAAHAAIPPRTMARRSCRSCGC